MTSTFSFDIKGRGPQKEQNLLCRIFYTLHQEKTQMQEIADNSGHFRPSNERVKLAVLMQKTPYVSEFFAGQKSSEWPPRASSNTLLFL